MQSTILSFMTPQRTQVSDFHSPGPQDLMDLKGSVDFLAPKGNMDLLDPMDQMLLPTFSVGWKGWPEDSRIEKTLVVQETLKEATPRNKLLMTPMVKIPSTRRSSCSLLVNQ